MQYLGAIKTTEVFALSWEEDIEEGQTLTSRKYS